MTLHVILGGVGLADIRLVAEDHREGGTLCGLQLLRHDNKGVGLARLPFYLVTQTYAQASGQAYPVAVADSSVCLSLLDHGID